MRTFNPLAWVILALYTALVFWLIYLYPPAHDTWGHVRPQPWYQRSIIDAFVFGFLQNNPRIGQPFLAVFGGEPLTRAILGTVSFLFLVVGIFVLATARLPRLTLPDATILLWSFAMIALLGGMPGQMIFYIPYNSNYILGLGFLLAFLAPYRIDLSTHPLSSKLMGLPIIVLGFAAGMSNEETVPSIIALGGLAILLGVFFRRNALKLWHFLGYASLIASYAALYYAPGQHVRYGEGVKTSALDKFFINFSDKLELAMDYTFRGVWPVFCIVAAVCLIAAALDKFRPEKSAVFVAVSSLACAIMMAVTCIASPFLGERLFFASNMMVGAALVTLIASLVSFSPRTGAALAIVGALLPAAFLSEATNAITKYASAFEARKADAAAQISAGNEVIHLTPYNLKAIGPDWVIHHDENPPPSIMTVHPSLMTFLGAKKVEFRK